MKPAQIFPLTSLRGLAAWWVAVYHFRDYLPLPSPNPIYDFFSRGYLAVDLFFVLSGFVLQLSYFRNPIGITRSSIVEFALARVARIYPLHVFMLMLFTTVPLAIILYSSRGDTGN